MINKILAAVCSIRYFLLNFVLPIVASIGIMVWMEVSIWSLLIIIAVEVAAIAGIYQTYHRP